MVTSTLDISANIAVEREFDNDQKLGEGTKALISVFNEQQKAFMVQPFPSVSDRLKSLDVLDVAIRENVEEIKLALTQDFGCRSEDETLVTEVMGVLKSISYTKKHLKAWMRPRARSVDITFKPASAKVMPQPLGVVGIVSPWNFPFGLVIKPLISALAAGNRVMIKPSELTPNVANLLEKLLGTLFDKSQVCIIQGDASVAQQFVGMPFNHLLFTGSTHIGKRVMAAAAKNLTPLTLELGGKSPVLVDREINMLRVTKSIVTGKLLNSGQTCTAPDYVLLPAERLQAFIDSFLEVSRKMYPDPISSSDYTSIINSKHFNRLEHYLSEAKVLGTDIIDVYPESQSNLQLRKFLPKLLINPLLDSTIMEEEIFGPLLPIFTYNTLDEAILFINKRPRPLALYVFTTDKKVEEEVLEKTISGGVTINDTLLHYSQESLPFGGVGESGFGAYHGLKGFKTFSHIKPIFKQSRLNGLDLLRAPYNKTSRWVLDLILKIA